MYSDSLNIASGKVFARDWFNIDVRIGGKKGEINHKDGYYILNHDIKKGIPVEDSSIQNIYTSHFIEHLKYKQAIKFVSECYKKLKVGGILRITCPDLSIWIKNYYENNNEFFDDYHKKYRSVRFKHNKLKGNVFMSQFYNVSHKWCYDYESLSYLMESCGFENIRKCSFGDSAILNINTVEDLYKEREFETLYVEGFKT